MSRLAASSCAAADKCRARGSAHGNGNSARNLWSSQPTLHVHVAREPEPGLCNQLVATPAEPDRILLQPMLTRFLLTLAVHALLVLLLLILI
jgi:hypothetical protein